VGALRSLRGRVALAATLAVAGVLVVIGAVAVASFANREHARVDEALRSRPIWRLVRALEVLHGEGRPFPFPRRDQGRGPPPGVPGVGPPGDYVRVVMHGEAVRSVDVPPGLPLPSAPGLRTVGAGGSRYRSLTHPLPGGGLLEVGTDLSAAEQRIAGLRRLLVLLGALGVAVAGALSWWLAGVALRPLRALRDAAGRVSSTQDLSTRLPAAGTATEVRELSASMNAMLARLQRSSAATDAALEATRRFAGDLGHELRTPMTALLARLGSLRRNPALDPHQRATTLEGAEGDADRAVRLLETLQTLARGDAGATLPRELVDLSAVTEAAVDAAGARHPAITWRLRQPPDDLVLDGWPDGLRALVENLLENAAQHGRRDGIVEVTLQPDGNQIVLTVDDDGSGVPDTERDWIFDRFARGQGASPSGSGLGLALVCQQARLHRGEVAVSDSPLGGARFRVDLPSA
jgi:two-component system sensor histidine kinase PrrB